MSGTELPPVEGLTAPDGSFTITDAQGVRALLVFQHFDTTEPLQAPEGTRPGFVVEMRKGRLAGHVGAAMGIDADATCRLYLTNIHFREYIQALLTAYDLQARRWKAAAS